MYKTNYWMFLFFGELVLDIIPIGLINLKQISKLNLRSPKSSQQYKKARIASNNCMELIWIHILANSRWIEPFLS